jgi:hypothetical protein
MGVDGCRWYDVVTERRDQDGLCKLRREEGWKRWWSCRVPMLDLNTRPGGRSGNVVGTLTDRVLLETCKESQWTASFGREG